MASAAKWLLVRGDSRRIPLPSESVDFVFGSPPYRKARLYLENGVNLGISRDTDEWIDWMLAVTTEALRVCRGAVVWVAAGSTEDRTYQPICEGLMYRWWAAGGSAYRPCYWRRVGIPGSGGDQWFRADVEYVMCFKRPGKLPWSDNTAMGHPPKWAPGGEMSYRQSDGTRVNQWGMNIREDGSLTATSRGRDGGGEGDTRARRTRKPSHVVSTKRNAFGVRTDVPVGTRPTGAKDPEAEGYRARGPADHFREAEDGQVKGAHDREICAIANPGNVIETVVGGGVMGHKFAHINEAPFPEALAEHFIRSLCPPGGRVLDPFSGSGTTASVAARLGRQAIGLDIRQSQCDLGRRRIADQLLREDRPHMDRPSAARNGTAPTNATPLFAALAEFKESENEEHRP